MNANPSNVFGLSIKYSSLSDEYDIGESIKGVIILASKAPTTPAVVSKESA
jgi:hypothetical protein